MEIFGKHIFGTDTEQFLQLPVLEQVQWIKSKTKQQNDDIIDEFLSNIPTNNDKNCLNCGNISKTIPTEVEPSSEVVSTSRNGKRGANKGRKDNKTT